MLATSLSDQFWLSSSVGCRTTSASLGGKLRHPVAVTAHRASATSPVAVCACPCEGSVPHSRRGGDGASCVVGLGWWPSHPRRPPRVRRPTPDRPDHPEDRAQFRAERIAAFSASGLFVRAFYLAHDLHEKRFGTRRRNRGRSPAARPRPRPTPRSAGSSPSASCPTRWPKWCWPAASPSASRRRLTRLTSPGGSPYSCARRGQAGGAEWNTASRASR